MITQSKSIAKRFKVHLERDCENGVKVRTLIETLQVFTTLCRSYRFAEINMQNFIVEPVIESVEKGSIILNIVVNVISGVAANFVTGFIKKHLKHKFRNRDLYIEFKDEDIDYIEIIIHKKNKSKK